MSSDSLPVWFRGLCRCVACGSQSLSVSGAGVTCSDCGQDYPLSNRTPMFLQSDAFIDNAEHIAAYLGDLDPEAVERALGAALRYRLRSPGLRNEFSQVLDRYPLPGALSSASNGQKFELIAHYFNPRFAAGAVSHRSFRFRSNLDGVMKSGGERPFHLSYWLTDAAGGRLEGVRSEFPIPVGTGDEITIPVRIQAPPRPGRYQIEVLVVQEHVGWHLDCPLFVGEIEVVEDLGSDDIVRMPHRGRFELLEDLAASGNVYADAAGAVRQASGRDELTVLEIACGSDPLILRHYLFGTRCVACDLSFPQAQIGSLTALHQGRVPSEKFCFVSADVFDAPFVAGAFDVIVVCAALHHFSDTTKALIKLRELLAPHGRIVLVREPGKVVPNDAATIADLERGYCKQQFELDEYEVMFARSALKPTYQQLDFDCSYKAVLECVEESDAY